MAVLLRYPRMKTWVGSGLRWATCVHALVVLIALLFAAGAVALVAFMVERAPLPPFYLRILSYAVATRDSAADPWEPVRALRDGSRAITLHQGPLRAQVSVEVCATLWLHVVGLVSDCTSVTLGDFAAGGCGAFETYLYAVELVPRREYPHTCTLAAARWPQGEPTNPEALSDPEARPCAGAIGVGDVSYSCIARPDALAEIVFSPAPGSYPLTLYTVFWIALFCLLVAAAAFAATYKALVPLAFAAARADGGLRCYLEGWAPEGEEPCARAARGGGWGGSGGAVGAGGATSAATAATAAAAATGAPVEIGLPGPAAPPAAAPSAAAGPWPSRSWGTSAGAASQALS